MNLQTILYFPLIPLVHDTVTQRRLLNTQRLAFYGTAITEDHFPIA